MTGGFAFFAASVLVCASATFGVSMLRLPNLAVKALAWALAATTVIVAKLLIAGAILDDLSAWVVPALNATITSVAAVVWLATGQRTRWSSETWRGHIRGVVSEMSTDRWLLVLVAAATAEVMWRIAIAYVMPPYANDALWYHLTTVGGWLQVGEIGSSELSIWSTVYPMIAIVALIETVPRRWSIALRISVVVSTHSTAGLNSPSASRARNACTRVPSMPKSWAVPSRSSRRASGDD